MSIEENQGLPFGFDSDPASDQDIELLTALARNALQFSEESQETSYPLNCGCGNIYFCTRVDGGENFTELVVTDEDDEALLELLYDADDVCIAGTIEGEHEGVIDDEAIHKTVGQLDDICSLMKIQGLKAEEVQLIEFIERVARMYHTRSDREMNSYLNHPSARTVASMIRELIQKRQAATLIRHDFSHSIEGAGLLGVVGFRVESVNPDDKELYPELVASFEPLDTVKSKDFILPWSEYGLPVTRVFSGDEDREDEDEEGHERPDRVVVTTLIGHFVTYLSDQMQLGEIS